MSKVPINQRTEFGFDFRELEPWCQGEGTAENAQHDPQPPGRKKEREQRELHESFGSSKPIHYDTPSPTRPHLLILPKQSTTLSPSLSSHT